ncbi:MAG: hypothetical protein Q9207_003939 [Kuettlingeria erythrocarpa]
MGFYYDGYFDDLVPSSLRIPPLLDPFPFPTTTDRRLSPLEPNAGTDSNIEKEAAKLTGRGKALAEAKPIGDPEDNELRPIHSTSRKRPRTYDARAGPDFVQLPKPAAIAEEDKLAPFLPISALNQLLEPPPSAGLFPPITPNGTIFNDDRSISTGSSSQIPCYEQQFQGNGDQLQVEANNATYPYQRLWVRKRTMWTEEETYSLVQGLDKFGVGKWTKILKHPEYSFRPDRNAVDLKDRYRTIMGVSRIERAAKGVLYKDLLGFTNGVQKSNPEPPPEIEESQEQKEEWQKPRKRPKHLWSFEEDESLEKGYRRHGFCWKAIANDLSLALGDRTGSQIRDRFRKRFPGLYSEVPPPSTNPRHAPSKSTRLPQASMPKDQGSAVSDQDIRSQGTDDLKKGTSAPTGMQSTIPPKQTSSTSIPQGIYTLLNSDEPDNAQPSLRSDDCDGNVTLAPSLWEDLCAKPMFELD